MTKAQLINELKMIEARAWKQYQDHQGYCQLANGPDVDPINWQEWQKNGMTRYSTEWCVVKGNLDALGIEPFNYNEVQELKKANKL